MISEQALAQTDDFFVPGRIVWGYQVGLRIGASPALFVLAAAALTAPAFFGFSRISVTVRTQ